MKSSRLERSLIFVTRFNGHRMPIEVLLQKDVESNARQNRSPMQDKSAEDIHNTAGLGHGGVVGGHPFGAGHDSQDNGL